MRVLRAFPKDKADAKLHLRMADGKVPSIYGPTADEPWIQKMSSPA